MPAIPNIFLKVGEAKLYRHLPEPNKLAERVEAKNAVIHCEVGFTKMSVALLPGDLKAPYAPQIPTT